MKTNEQWLEYYDDHVLDIDDDVIEFYNELFNPDDDLFFIYSAKLHYSRYEL